MTSKAETIPARIAALKDTYIRQLPQQADELGNLWQAIRQHGWIGNDANRFRVLVHRLAGTAGTFGLLSLSDYAQGLDKLLDTIAFSETRPAADDVKRIGQLLHALLAEFDMINASFQAPDERDPRLETAPAIADLIANMSHELRTPLNSILGFSQLLEMDTEQNLTVQQKDSLKPILNAGWHLLGLLNEIIDLAKIEAGKAPLAMAGIDIQTVIRQAISLTGQAARDRHITVHNHLGNNATMVLADARRLRQVLVNLLSSTIKYSLEQTDIAINGHRDQDATVVLSISGTGTDLPENDIQDLFTTFNRPPGSEGPDLGLVICQQLIKRMHGEIGAYNSPDGGSTFWLKLQAAADDTNDKEQPVAD